MVPAHSICEQDYIRAPDEPRSAFDLLLTNRSLQQVGRTIDRAAQSDVPILIVGESGTGKELVARAIHEKSHRASMPFVCLNLAAVPVELSESILFGHEKGAFTGASHASEGYCRRANCGTLFLDEIGEADWSLQSKLLRFLQNHEIQPVGSQTLQKVDVRIVAATNCDLADAIREKRFREDLFYRLNVVQIYLPPLRERLEDIFYLIDFFLMEFNFKYGRNCDFSASLRHRLFEAQWPGNVRQLRAVVENLVLLAEHEMLGLQDLPSDLLPQIGTRQRPSAAPAPHESIRELDRLTKDLIESILQQSNGNVTSAAQRLGISRSTLYRWIKRFHQSQCAGTFDDSPS